MNECMNSNFLPNPKEGTGGNSPPLLLNDTLTINVFKLLGTVITPVIISSSLTCVDILVLFITVLSVFSILTVILLGYSPLHNVLTYEMILCVNKLIKRNGFHRLLVKSLKIAHKAEGYIAMRPEASADELQKNTMATTPHVLIVLVWALKYHIAAH